MKAISFIKKYSRIITGMVIILLAVNVQTNIAQEEIGNEDKTLSPYFFIESDDPTVDQLPLKSTLAEVNIAGVIADVRVAQVYKNEGKNALEAIYVFPASTRAAVYSMRMTIGDRTIVAEIQEKEKARQNYEQAKAEGKSASLLEQQRPNVFQMNVANIMPGDVIKVEMFYTELLVPEENVYEFVYPTVVGPRYSEQSAATAPTSEQWIANPYTKQGEKPLYTFDIQINIDAGLPIHDVRCTSHDASINYDGPNVATIAPKNKDEGNKDFIVQYRLTGNQIQSGLLLYEGKDENFFLAMIQPPKRVQENEIPPREYVFVIDVSGSMYGFPLDITKKLMKNLIGNLNPNDKFNVMLFSGGSRVLSEQSISANSENIKKAIHFIENETGGGGTRLLPALERALALKGTENYSRSFVIATDGYVAVEKEAFDLIRNNLDNANFFSFGIGSSVNRFIIEGMAHVGYGEPFVITDPSEADATAERFRRYIQTPALTNIEVEYNDFSVYDVEPLSVPDVLAERPVILYGKWRGNKRGKIELKGTTGDEVYDYALDVGDVKASDKNVALKYLWARQRIKMLDDYTNVSHDDKDHINQITQLGLKYNLLTNYTSFIAIDSEVRNQDGTSTTVKQPLPLPEGVSNYAVGVPATGNVYKSAKRSSGYGKLSGGVTYAPVKTECAELSIVDDEKILDYDVAVFSITETSAEFNGGEAALKEFLTKNMKYPQIALENSIEGVVIVEFTVDKKGNISDIKIIQSIHFALDSEAIRLIKLMNGKWKPATQDGKPVKTKMTVPIKFSLS